jgi:hypothetical protein
MARHPRTPGKGKQQVRTAHITVAQGPGSGCCIQDQIQGILPKHHKHPLLWKKFLPRQQKNIRLASKKELHFPESMLE